MRRLRHFHIPNLPRSQCVTKSCVPWDIGTSQLQRYGQPTSSAVWIVSSWLSIGRNYKTHIALDTRKHYALSCSVTEYKSKLHLDFVRLERCHYTHQKSNKLEGIQYSTFLNHKNFWAAAVGILSDVGDANFSMKHKARL